ncbi:uncharacterized protein LOC116773510 isoform X1 [Danaus plexippus]|uniref:uncharacterized protein LOC116773510 isoform X1 n=1 Tax=Danaus plexippus TaxID=13037 RepID=UPI002AB0FAB8|nr:uncharacterized protein LOC116773510 isoform X1 [Danaus plexippus]
MTENIEFYQNQIALARTEIKNLRQRISALKHEHQKEISHIKSTLSSLRCSKCAEEATTVVNNDTRDGGTSTDSQIKYKPIGYIETSFNNKRGVPRQTSVMTNSVGVITIDTNVFTNPEHALSGLEEFSHIWIIYHFHMTESNSTPAKVSPPRLVGEKKGVFSTRSPHRPCPIGLSLVKIHSIQGNKIHFYGVDMVNGTPVLDIKPYIPQYDYPISEAQERPPTEGIDLAGLNLNVSSLNVTTEYGDELPGDLLTTLTPSENLDDVLSIQRGEPDGQERYTAQASNINQADVRVASWITNTRNRYQVAFTDEALMRIENLIGSRADSFKANIESLLSEDPRSVYVKTKYKDHEYNCVLEDLSITCVFDETTSVCTIIAVKSADELQN